MATKITTPTDATEVIYSSSQQVEGDVTVNYLGNTVIQFTVDTGKKFKDQLDNEFVEGIYSLNTSEYPSGLVLTEQIIP